MNNKVYKVIFNHEYYKQSIYFTFEANNLKECKIWALRCIDDLKKYFIDDEIKMYKNDIENFTEERINIKDGNLVNIMSVDLDENTYDMYISLFKEANRQNNLYKVVNNNADWEVDTSILVSAKDLEECKAISLQWNWNWDSFDKDLETIMEDDIKNFTEDRLDEGDEDKPVNIFLVKNESGVLHDANKGA